MYLILKCLHKLGGAVFQSIAHEYVYHCSGDLVIKEMVIAIPNDSNFRDFCGMSTNPLHVVGMEAAVGGCWPDEDAFLWVISPHAAGPHPSQ